uniref:MULE transposase domain-containing protein n=1 Tax=Tanacetum cinerariifolium TaxID=118510 RepID=A0A6L2P3S4_TANCI|nr:hypothetical protein [Tanacetum cinerariifolium]
MRTRSFSNLPVVSPNPSTSNPKRRNRRCLKQPFTLEESPIDMMADQCTMAELLRTPTEGYAEAIVVPLILAKQLELKHSLINMMTSDKFFGLEKGNPHDHIRLGVNLLERRTQDVLMIIENKSKVQATLPPASVNAVEEICVTYGGALLYYQCLAIGGNTFPELRDNIQGYVSAATANYNQVNSIYRPLGMANQIRPTEQSYQALTQKNQIVPLNEVEKVKRMNEANMKALQTQIGIVKNELRNEMKILIQASMSNQTNEIKNMMASLFQMNTASTSGLGSLPSNIVANQKGELKAITTRSGLVLDGPTVPTPPPFINLREDKCVEETLTDHDLSEYTIKKILKALLSNKEKLQELANTPLNENFSAVILKKLPKKLRDPRKFLILCGFIELKCKALANLGASINLMPLSVWKKLGGPFLRTARALIDVHGEEPSGNPTFSSHPELTSPEVKNDIFDQEGGNVLLEKLLDLDSTKNLHPPLHVNPLSGSITYFSSLNQLLEEFVDELTLVTFPSKYDDDLQFDIEYNMKFVPFIGIDNHGKCVTLGSRMLLHEDTKSYKWLLNAFMTAFSHEPIMIVTDKDGAMKRAIEAIFKKAKHRICMWHIKQKIPSKTGSHEIHSDSYEIQSESHKIRQDLMTTSRSKRESLFFKSFTSPGATLVIFMMSYESSMERKRYKQKTLDFKTIDAAPKCETKLEIKCHAAQVYTRMIFLLVQMEIIEGYWSCTIQDLKIDDGCETVIIRDKKPNDNRSLFHKKGKEQEKKTKTVGETARDYKYLFDLGNDVAVMPCGHSIHKKCLKDMQQHS